MGEMKNTGHAKLYFIIFHYFIFICKVTAFWEEYQITMSISLFLQIQIPKNDD